MDLAGTLGLGDRELVAFVGAGGKKTALSHLVECGQDRGLAVAYTTTTHTPPLDSIPLVLSEGEPLGEALGNAGSPVGVAVERVSDPRRADEKVSGPAPGAVTGLYESGEFDWILVKADGARRREFKAPGPDEPVVPDAATHVVVLASIRVAGSPLDAPVVHRPDRVADIVDEDVGEPVGPGTVGRVVASDAGGLKNVPDCAAVTPVLNKADTAELRDRAREAARIALDGSDRLERCLVTSFRTDYCELVEG